jgi:hypothetical protein
MFLNNTKGDEKFLFSIRIEPSPSAPEESSQHLVSSAKKIVSDLVFDPR